MVTFENLRTLSTSALKQALETETNKALRDAIRRELMQRQCCPNDCWYQED